MELPRCARNIRSCVMQHRGYSISTRVVEDHWVADIRRIDGKDFTVDGATRPMFTTLRAATSDDAENLAFQAIDSGQIDPVSA
jgi:hypothetical protein